MKRSLFCIAASLVVTACGGEEVTGGIGTRSDALCLPAHLGTYRLRNNFTGHCIRATASGIVMASTCSGADRNWKLFQFQPSSCLGQWYQAENGNGAMASLGGTVVYDTGTVGDHGTVGLDAWVPQGTNSFISFIDSPSCLHETASSTLNFTTCGTNDRSRWTALPAY